MAAPERIWVQWPHANGAGLAFTCNARPPALRHEYIRADLIPAALALVKERDILIDRHERNLIVGAETRARAERLEAALREIESISVHSGGETHGVTADHWKMAFEQAQSIASAALK